MFKLIQRFLREESGQDFAKYALILGAIGVVAINDSLETTLKQLWKNILDDEPLHPLAMEQSFSNLKGGLCLSKRSQ